MKIHTIDLRFRGVDQAIAAYLVQSGSDLALIESGPGSTLENLKQGLAALGFGPQDIRHVLVTHIHLDHAGAAGWWAEQGARIYVHPKGARHLVDPAKLFESARLVYGDAMESLWGEMRPVPEDRLTVLEDNQSVEIGRLSITAWDTPGHARHHHCFIAGEAAFTGDVAGVRLPGSQFLSVTGAPPQFDPEAYDRSLQRLAAAGFSAIYPTHFGAIEGGVADHLNRYREAVRQSAEWVKAQLNEGIEGAALAEKYAAFCRDRARSDGVDDEVWARYETANASAISADGIALYWKKREEG